MRARSGARPLWKSPIWRRQCGAAYLFILPAMMILLTFIIYPTFRVFILSFTSENWLGRPARFVGFDNYTFLLSTSAFIRSLEATVRFSVLGLVLQMGAALMLAVLLVKGFRGEKFFRTIYFIPVTMSLVVTSLLWRMLYNMNLGLFNNVLVHFGFMRQHFLSSMEQALPGVVVTYAWKTFGFYMMIFIAGLKGIPPELYESAMIDGANAWQRFVRITLPLLKRTTLFVFVIGSINIIAKSIVPVFTMTWGGPRGTTTTTIFYIWQEAFNRMEVGVASAATVMLFFVVIVITAMQFFLGDRDNTK